MMVTRINDMPVTCTMNYYHYLASHLREKVLARMREALEARLSDIEPNAGQNPPSQ